MVYHPQSSWITNIIFLDRDVQQLKWILMMITCWGWWFSFPMFLHMSFLFSQESQETIIIQVHDIVLMRPCSNITDPAYTASSQWLVLSKFGGFLKWGYPQIIFLIGFFTINHVIWGAPILGNKHLFTFLMFIVASNKTRWNPRTRMLTRMLMVQMSKHMVMQSRTISFCNSLYNSLVHVSLVTSLQCGVESVECGVWSEVRSVECIVWSGECRVRKV